MRTEDRSQRTEVGGPGQRSEVVRGQRSEVRGQRSEVGGRRSEVGGRRSAGPGPRYVVEASTNLVRWTPLATNAAPNGPFNFIDADSVLYPRRFYRIDFAP